MCTHKMTQKNKALVNYIKEKTTYRNNKWSFFIYYLFFNLTISFLLIDCIIAY